MNYILQINAFWNNIRQNGQLSLSASNLYFLLLEKNNSYRWKAEFTVDPESVFNLISISKNTYYKALSELVDRGFILFIKSDNRSLLGRIKIIPLYQNLVYEVGNEVVDGHYSELDASCDANITLDKQVNKKTTKPIKEKTVVSEIFDFIEVEYEFSFKTWLQYKKDRREGYKNSASILACYKKLKKDSGNNPENAKQIIENSMGSNYSGFFPLKNSPFAKPEPKSKALAIIEQHNRLRRAIDNEDITPYVEIKENPKASTLQKSNIEGLAEKMNAAYQLKNINSQTK